MRFDHAAQQVPDIGEAIAWWRHTVPGTRVLHQDVMQFDHVAQQVVLAGRRRHWRVVVLDGLAAGARASPPRRTTFYVETWGRRWRSSPPGGPCVAIATWGPAPEPFRVQGDRFELREGQRGGRLASLHEVDVDLEAPPACDTLLIGLYVLADDLRTPPWAVASPTLNCSVASPDARWTPRRPAVFGHRALPRALVRSRLQQARPRPGPQIVRLLNLRRRPSFCDELRLRPA